MSESSRRDADFRRDLLRHDGVCVFTDVDELDDPLTGIPIIPYRKGDEWIQHIVVNRPYDEPIHDISIDDIQNGLICISQIRNHFNGRLALILKTSDAILNENDVEPSCQREWRLPPGHSYPTDSRYTSQHIDKPIAPVYRWRMPDNNDMTFLTTSELPKPSGLLLNYNYGATAVKHWGRNTSIFFEHTRAFHPEVSAAMAPSRTSDRENYQRCAKKCKLQETEVQVDASRHELQESNQEWDEDDIMLFFWGNSKAARETHQDEEQARKQYIESWRSSVIEHSDS